jgi:hypothetical protein
MEKEKKFLESLKPALKGRNATFSVFFSRLVCQFTSPALMTNGPSADERPPLSQ